MHVTKIRRVYVTKFLGVEIYAHLNWKYHINHICSKLSKCVGILAEARKKLCKSLLINLYYSFAYPYLIYCTYGVILKIFRKWLVHKFVPKFHTLIINMIINCSIFKQWSSMSILFTICYYKSTVLPEGYRNLHCKDKTVEGDHLDSSWIALPEKSLYWNRTQSLIIKFDLYICITWEQWPTLAYKISAVAADELATLGAKATHSIAIVCLNNPT